MTKYTILSMFAFAILGGCSNTGRMARIDPAGVTARQKDVDKDSPCRLITQYRGDNAQSINLDCYKFDPADTETAYALSTKTDGEAFRNRLQSVLINQANFVCQLEKGRLYANRATADVAFDFASSGLSGAGTIVSGELAKSILSGLAGLSTATRSNLNANIYQNQLIPAISRVMDAERKSQLLEISARSKQDLADYSTDEMITLVNEYHRACSFEKGVQLLLNAALNKEGVDTIIRGINLRDELRSINQQIDGQLTLRNKLAKQKLDTSVVDETLTALQTKLQQASIKMAENRETAQNVTTTPIDDEE